MVVGWVFKGTNQEPKLKVSNSVFQLVLWGGTGFCFVNVAQIAFGLLERKETRVSLFSWTPLFWFL